MPLSTDDFILTHKVAAGVVDPRLVALSLRTIVEVAPNGDTPDHSDIKVDAGGVVTDITIATPFGELIPVA